MNFGARRFRAWRTSPLCCRRRALWTTGRDPWSVRSGTARPGPRNLRSSALGSAARKRGARRTTQESIGPSPRPSSASDRGPVRWRVPWRLACSEEAARPPTPALPWMAHRSPAAVLWGAPWPGPPSFARIRFSSPRRPPSGVPAAALRLRRGRLSSAARRPSRWARPAASPSPAQPAPPEERTQAKEAFPPVWAARLWQRFPYLRRSASDSRNSHRRRERRVAQGPR